MAYLELVPGVSDQSSRVVDDALKLAKAGVKVDREELSDPSSSAKRTTPRLRFAWKPGYKVES